MTKTDRGVSSAGSTNPVDTTTYDLESELLTGEAVALDVRSTSFLLRAAGAMIDFFVTIAIAVGLLALMLAAVASGTIDSAAVAAISTSIIVFSCVVAPTTIELVSKGRSFGRWAVGSRIVRDDGGATGFRHALIRALAGFLEIYMTLGGIAALVGLLNPQSKRLGDLLAGTYSQHERVPKVITPVIGVPPELAHWASLADVARMPDPLSRRIAQFLKQAHKLTPMSRTRLAGDLAHEAAAFVSPVPQAAPETFLFAVAAVRRDREYAALMRERERLARLHPVLAGQPHGFPER